MSSQPISSRTRPAAARPAGSSFKDAFLRFARDIWHSYQRHSQYQVMLAAGRDHGVPEDVVHGRRR